MPLIGRRRNPSSTSSPERAAAADSTSAGRATSGAPTRALVVGIGASAGGLQALTSFFKATPHRTGLVFVVVIHLDPTHESLLPDLLARTTPLPVEHARDGQPLETDHVYVIPPNHTLRIEDGLLRVREAADRRALRTTVDQCFRSLATDQGMNAVGIVLSGTGTEGTLGARAIKAEGGLVLAQSPQSASQPGMPASVIASGCVDVVTLPVDMPRVLLDFARDPRTVRGSRPTQAEPPSPGAFEPILDVLPRRTGDAGRTSFFRDPAVFEELAELLSAVLAERGEAEPPVRIWVPGCATGEDAYSIAIVLAEQMAVSHAGCRTQIFATDLDEQALAVARRGTYPETISAEVTAQRLQRFFTREDHQYTIAKPIRESVVFAAHDLTSDPGFSRLDLVSCRQALIDLKPDVQEQVLRTFHAALNPGGYLVLGSAEGIVPLTGLFAPLSAHRHLFRRLGTPTDPHAARSAGRPPAAGAGRARATALPNDTASVADRLLLQHLAPSAVVVRATGEIVRVYGTLDRYMHLPAGEATLEALTLAHHWLQPALRAALHDAVRHHHKKVLTVPPYEKTGRAVRLTVTPLDVDLASESLWLMIFEELPRPPRPDPGAGGRVAQLEAELQSARHARQQLVEQLEVGNEELRAANEEMLSINEELQSSNEELRTAEEQLRHLNQTLEERVAERTKWLTLMHDVTLGINEAASWDEGLHRVLRRICESENWQIGYVYLPDRNDANVLVPVICWFADERVRPFHEVSARQRYTRGQKLPGRVFADGAAVWSNDADTLLELLPIRAEAARRVGLRSAVALPIRFGQDVVAVLELFSDQPHAPDELLENLLNDVSDQIGKVLERERATARMADLVWREQQGLLHTLHDSLGQTLTGLGMLSSGLGQQLTGSDPGAADTARQIAEQARLALEQVRQLSRGLFPVEIDPEGLLPALRGLAATTEAIHKVRVQVEGDVPPSIRDSRVATHLYRIAQEAVTNAVKHARASTIRIEVDAAPGLTILRVIDDGVGIRTDDTGEDGLGLRILRYRATSIGAVLSIDPAPGGGTVITCTLGESLLPPRQDVGHGR